MKGGKNEGEAILSLRLYIINGRILSTTAAMLYVHRNTLWVDCSNIKKAWVY